MKSKLLVAGEWCAVRPALNAHFGAHSPPLCELCRRMSCATHWYSISRRVFRCFRCFTPDSQLPGAG